VAFQGRNPLALAVEFSLDAAEHSEDLIHLATEILVFEPRHVHVFTRTRPAPLRLPPFHRRNRRKNHAERLDLPSIKLIGGGAPLVIQ
jgi:hypothetical protein